MTSVKTKPIDDLTFPKLTECPPRGPNTALNYDLMRADNESLTQEMRANLSREAKRIFDPFGPHQQNIEYMLASANEENIEQVVDGFQTFPKPYNTGFEVRLWNDKGTITTPWFGQQHNETYFLEDKEYHVIFEIPDNVKQYIGDGTLVVEMEADVEEEDEKVFYSKSKYNFRNTSILTWRAEQREN